MNNNPYNNPHVKHSSFRITVTITVVTEANQTTMMVTEDTIKVATTMIHTRSVTVVMVETGNNTAAMINKMHVIVVHV